MDMVGPFKSPAEAVKYVKKREKEAMDFLARIGDEPRLVQPDNLIAAAALLERKYIEAEPDYDGVLLRITKKGRAELERGKAA